MPEIGPENDDGNDVFVAFDAPSVIGEAVGIGIEGQNRWPIVAVFGDYQELVRRQRRL